MDFAVLVARGVLIVMQFVVFGLSLGITVISFQAYRDSGSERLQYAFIGFAFLSMGVALGNVVTQIGTSAGGSELLQVFFHTTRMVPFAVGFAALYVSLYR
ncbi:DUF7521 family protein [Halococcoides cellulosivorans]|uniref:Uncharacterized protein n=1 Tax=Halococcoides cellulosivorans TaxID=1679096 RepID=A0A2R4X2Y8_9EURY|nr:hypothetical protein [Halococcoides cellulosivorans]AWB28155.1 hypothetical protein HARCEL1_10785 [Halococcoides cellulosivorans]